VILRTISVWRGVHLMTGLVKETADTLQKTLNEEEEADKKLTSIAESQVNVYAASRGR
jgi:ferritin-like metal-binding protein YciE